MPDCPDHGNDSESLMYVAHDAQTRAGWTEAELLGTVLEFIAAQGPQVQFDFGAFMARKVNDTLER